MPQQEAPDDVPETSSPKLSIQDSVPSESESFTFSDFEYEFSVPNSGLNSTDNDSEGDEESHTLSTLGFDKIRVPIEQNLREYLMKITETEDLDSVTSIKLKVIARDFSLQRLPNFLPNLTELNLDGSCLMSLRDLGCDLNSLKILHVSRCGLNSLDGLLGLQGLTELYAGGNNIKDLSACASLPNIQVLDLRRNNINEPATVSFLALCTTLKHLILENCGVTKVENYRGTVKNLLPDLVSLDGKELTEEDSIKEPVRNEEKVVPRFPPIPTRYLKESSDNFFEKALKRSNTNHEIIAIKCKSDSIVRPQTARGATDKDFHRIINDNSDFSAYVRKYVCFKEEQRNIKKCLNIVKHNNLKK